MSLILGGDLKYEALPQEAAYLYPYQLYLDLYLDIWMPWDEHRELVKLRERKIRQMKLRPSLLWQFRVWNSAVKILNSAFSSLVQSLFVLVLVFCLFDFVSMLFSSLNLAEPSLK